MFTSSIVRDFQNVASGSLSFRDFLDYWGFIVVSIDGVRFYHHVNSGRYIYVDPVSGLFVMSR